MAATTHARVYPRPLPDIVFMENPENVYVLQQRLGKGSFGSVYKAIDKETKSEVAVKVMRLPFRKRAKDKAVAEMKEEIDLLR